MGNTNTKLPRPDPDMDFFFIAFQPPDRIKLVLADESTIDTVRRTADSWKLGLQTDTRCSDGSYKLRFAGAPFTSNNASKPGVANAKLMALKILANLHEFGWQLSVTSELTKDSEASTWFFRRYTFVEPSLTPSTYNDGSMKWKSTRFFCLALHSVDKLQLINGPEAIREAFVKTVLSNYTPGTDGQAQVGTHLVEVKLLGRPWWNDVDGANDMNGPLEARKLLLKLIKQFRKIGYKIYGVVNLGDSSHCLYFIETATEPEDEDDGDDRFCLISLYDDDGLMLIDADETVVEATKSAINNAWPGGIHYERLQTNASEKISRFRIKGRPWRSTGPDVIASRRFISNLFRTLLAHGWRVEQPLEISQESIGGKMTTFIMRSCAKCNLPHVCINLSDLNKIRIIGDGSWVIRHQSATSLSGASQRDRCSSIDSAPSSPKLEGQCQSPRLRRRHSSSSKRRLTKSERGSESVKTPKPTPSSPPVTPRLLITPPSDENLANSNPNAVPQAYVDLIHLVRHAIERSWPYGIDRERDYYGSREFRLQGCPWAGPNTCSSGGSNRPLVARVMMCYILKAITEAGWQVYASADITSSKLYPLNPVKGVLSKTNSGGMEIHPLAPAAVDVHSWFLVYHGGK